jgi:hypothetical protein
MTSLVSPAPFAPPRPCRDTLTIAPHSTTPRSTIPRIARTTARITARITVRITARITARITTAALAAGVSPTVTSTHSPSCPVQDMPADTHLFRVRMCCETIRDRPPLHSQTVARRPRPRPHDGHLLGQSLLHKCPH